MCSALSGQPLAVQIGYPADLSRPAVSEKRLSLRSAGNIRYLLKTPYSNGTTHVTAHAHPCAHGIRAFIHIIACIEDQ